MRTAFIEQLIVEARSNPRIFFVVGDLGYSVVEPFAKEFPERFLNAGVAEQNMTGVAAGLAAEGFHVFTYSIANFPTFRCAEQIRNDIAYHRLPVTVVAVGGGLAYGNLGYSHHAVQDMALMRLFPNMLLAAPGNPTETRAVMRYLSLNPQPSYLRLGKAGEPVVHEQFMELTPGQLVYFHKSHPKTKNLVLTTGATLKLAVEAHSKHQDQNWTLASLPLWSSEYGPCLVEELSSYHRIIVVEDHLQAGGFGSFIQELIQEFGLSVKVQRMALHEKVCGHVAGQLTLNSMGHLTVERLIELQREPSSKPLKIEGT